ncbi:hypothetical protein BO70DRAFT_361559 [Aspergillus heteromorphus CBS 117.55]|uniref:Uncharacterized protein n=1 Tax=Aspergillus heteromorphus CBS 117.55 TaxID=1448321 RepID=A0A317WB66_9EURO|nr:uncharacterized protein BO70DRAFT_361559 [Aspergillus heteromorphus CBS 117.55]PWY83439.1 hypothetical protein BO70DRAFT_361559 [Aspergillus heteromorphus CBS 117.55]
MPQIVFSLPLPLVHRARCCGNSLVPIQSASRTGSCRESCQDQPPSQSRSWHPRGLMIGRSRVSSADGVSRQSSRPLRVPARHFR